MVSRPWPSDRRQLLFLVSRIILTKVHWGFATHNTLSNTKAHPSVAELLFPVRQADAKNGFRELQALWTLKELQIALRSVGDIISQSSPGHSSHRFCIFIDGLDECNRYHRGLIKLLQSFVKDGNIKLCISSRP
jgi:hypothetical protein